MTVYTFSEARQKLASVLDEALRTGAVRIQRRDGSVFEIGPVARKSSPLDVPGVSLGITRDDILAALHESRERLVE